MNETIDFSRLFLSLAFVVLLIWLSAFVLKRFGLDRRLRGATGTHGRLQVMDVLYIDPKRRLMVVRADSAEYLLMVAGDSATVIEKLQGKGT